LAFIGPNGAGKSTTIKMLTGILYPTVGHIDVLGFTPTRERKKLAYKIGTVFGQKSQLWFHLPPMDSFKLLGYIYDMDSKKIDQRIKYLSEIFEIESLMDMPVRKMSLGQRIRCEIVASILHEPEIIFLDEPTIGLDVVVKQKIRTLITQINREENTTIFLTSHDAGDIEQLCERAIIINHGEIVFNNKVADLKTNYLNNKIVNIKHDGNLTIEEGDIKIIENDQFMMKLEIDTTVVPIDQTIGKLLQTRSINDITIEDAPLEEIIADIYQDLNEDRGR
jgi:ABC-2 type transport system ATP-binding protein|nr:ATP-binding cassette domain-containing protein [Vallitaleaceae bacterium]